MLMLASYKVDSSSEASVGRFAGRCGVAVA